MAEVNPIAVGAVGVGLVFIYSGLKGTQITRTLQDLIQGRPPSGANDNPITVATAPTAAAPGTGAAGGSAAANQAIARQLAARYGWSTGADWDALVQLWEHESGWNNHAENPASHAYGIPQALPYSKMPKAAWPERAGGTSNAGAQISWGLSYIRSRYGSPHMAWATWQSRSPHWY